jgi:hypothetical protein
VVHWICGIEQDGVTSSVSRDQKTASPKPKPDAGSAYLNALCNGAAILVMLLSAGLIGFFA